jgi:hypothetical protein
MTQSLGCQPRQSKVGDGTFRVFADDRELIPRSEWDERIKTAPDLSVFVEAIKDQNGEGQCASSATATTVEILRAMARMKYIELSPASLYKRVNGGKDHGSTLDGNLNEITEAGILPVSLFPAIGFRNALPDNWMPEAANFKLTESFEDVDTFDAMVTALLEGHPVPFGTWWNYPRKAGGHAIVAVKAVKEGGRYGVKIANSHGLIYGKQGFGTLWEPQVDDGLATFGGWAGRVATVSGGDLPTPK